MEHLNITSLVYGLIAIVGGVARYLKGFTDGKPFVFTIFLASAFTSGFSGYMFALMGESMDLPNPILFIMAGTGGFFGEQTLKFVYEWSKNKTL